MRALRAWLVRTLGLFQRHHLEDRMGEEIETHLRLHVEQNLLAGMSPADAMRDARLKLGGLESTRQACRERSTVPLIENLLQDVRYAGRQLLKTPAFTVTAVLTLALGIGATTSVFSAVYALLIRPLPYTDAARLVFLTTRWPNFPGPAAGVGNFLSPDFVAAREHLRSFAQLAAYTSNDANLISGEQAMRVTRANVTANFFSTLGANPQIGRFFSDKEDIPNGPHVVLISDHLWRQRFGASPRVLNTAIKVDGDSETIIGVLPRRFRFPDIEMEPEIYAPLQLKATASLSIDARVLNLTVLGLLKPGVNLDQARAETRTFMEGRLQHDYPPGFAHIARGMQTIVQPLQQRLTGDDRRPMLILLGAVGFVLLLACANIANLQLARTVTRRHEIAVRRALGASQPRIVRQLLVESLLLSFGSALAGLGLASAITMLIRHAQVSENTPIPIYSRAALMLRLPFGKLSSSIAIDGWVFVFTVVVAVLAAVLFGLMPAIRGARVHPAEALKAPSSRMSAARDQQGLRHGLLIAEVAIAVVLLASAGLLLRSFANLLHYDAGFDPSHRLTGTILLHDDRHRDDELRTLGPQLERRLRVLPGVTAAAVTSALPLQGYDLISAVTFEGAPVPSPGMRPAIPMISITPDYFRAAGTPLLLGRRFNDADDAAAPPVAIVNRAFAKQYLHDDALGKRFTTWGRANTVLTIVGVAGDTRRNALDQPIRPEIFLPLSQMSQPVISILLHTASDPALLVEPMRQALWSIDHERPLYDIQTMDQRISATLAQRRLLMLLLAAFAVLAVVLSAVGVYGVFSYSVTQRAQEMGIRLALGGSRASVVRLVVFQGARLIVLGGAIGLCSAAALSRTLSSLMVGITSHDAATFAAAWLLMTAVALLASAIPAAHAARTELLSTLRAE